MSALCVCALDKPACCRGNLCDSVLPSCRIKPQSFAMPPCVHLSSRSDPLERSRCAVIPPWIEALGFPSGRAVTTLVHVWCLGLNCHRSAVALLPPMEVVSPLLHHMCILKEQTDTCYVSSLQLPRAHPRCCVASLPRACCHSFSILSVGRARCVSLTCR